MGSRSLLIQLFALYATLVAAGLAFYLAQNSGYLSGGSIALPKLLWLCYAILFWFCLPALIVSDSRISPVWRGIYGVFLLNMVARAVVELWMMYLSHNWSPYYGIAHDVFSMLLLGTLLWQYRDRLQRDVWFAYTLVLLLMFFVEVIFVIYMLLNVAGSGSGVYFVPPARHHTAILAVTWGVVVLLTGYIVVLTRRWLRGEFVRTGT